MVRSAATTIAVSRTRDGNSNNRAQASWSGTPRPAAPTPPPRPPTRYNPAAVALPSSSQQGEAELGGLVEHGTPAALAVDQAAAVQDSQALGALGAGVTATD
jgi:hypothetical protein